mmetsp:Transcript_28796/g.41237  ORF Transcript_28796/g.41237 Transcript_28796/m.41237 type:complete len:271 (+) Transcript_28796:313-1125(+)
MHCRKTIRTESRQVGSGGPSPPNAACWAGGRKILHQQKALISADVGIVFHVGDHVLLRQGCRTIAAIVKEVYPDTDATYYLVTDEDGRDVQTETRFLQIVDANANKKSIGKVVTSHPPTLTVPQSTDSDSAKLNDILEAFQKTLVIMDQKEAKHKRELAQMHAKLNTLQPPVNPPRIIPDRTAVTTTQVVTGAPVFFFAVARGRRPESVGVHEFAIAQQEISGYPDAVWKRVPSIEEGWAFIVDYQEQKMLEVAANATPAHQDSGVTATK